MAVLTVTLVFKILFLLINVLKTYVAIDVRVPLDRNRYDFEFVYNYTKYLHSVYRFNSFVTFWHFEASRRPNNIVTLSFEEALVEDFNVPLIVCGKDSPAKLRHLIGLNNMVFVQFTGLNDTILDAVDHTLKGLHFITILFFYKDKSNTPPTAKEIREFFAWCWLRNMINVALTFQIIQVTVRRNLSSFNPNKAQVYIQNQVYTYTPFPVLTVQNLTQEIEQGKGEFTIDRITNVMGYVFKAPMFQQPPYVFLDSSAQLCKNGKYCAESLTGVSANIFKEYISQINGSIEIQYSTSMRGFENMSEIFLAPAKKKADIVPHPLSELIISSDYSDGSYPIAQSNLCIIVPTRQEMESQNYIPQAFQAEIWAFVLLTFLLLFATEICYNLQSLKTRIQWFSLALIAAVNLLLDQPNFNDTLRRLGRFYKLFHLVTALATFVLTNMFGASLTSLLSTAPTGVQINTVAQMLAADLQIMTTVTEKKLYFESNRLPSELIPKLNCVKTDVMERHRNSLNQSFAYIATAEIWRLLDYQQRHLQKPLFRMPGRELCTTKFFLRFPVQWDSPFTLSLAIFFMATQESGFALKWRDMATHQAKYLNFTKVTQRDVDDWRALSLQHFVFPILLICFLWFLAMFAFCLEVVGFYVARAGGIRRRGVSLLAAGHKNCHWKRPIRRRYGKFYKKALNI